MTKAHTGSSRSVGCTAGRPTRCRWPPPLKRNRTGLGSGPALRKVSHCSPAVSRESGTEFDWIGPLAKCPPGQTSGCRTQSRTSARTEPLAKTTPMSAVTMRDCFPRTARFNPSGCRDHTLRTSESVRGRMGKAPSCRGRRGPPGVPKGPPHVRVPAQGEPGPVTAASTRGRVGAAVSDPGTEVAQRNRCATHVLPCAARDAVSRAGPRSSPHRGCGRSLRTSSWDHRRLGTRAATRTANDARARSCRGRRCRRPCLRTPERQHSCQPAPGGMTGLIGPDNAMSTARDPRGGRPTTRDRSKSSRGARRGTTSAAVAGPGLMGQMA